jgi:hypothetical protein
VVNIGVIGNGDFDMISAISERCHSCRLDCRHCHPLSEDKFSHEKFLTEHVPPETMIMLKGDTGDCQDAADYDREGAERYSRPKPYQTSSRMAVGPGALV